MQTLQLDQKIYIDHNQIDYSFFRNDNYQDKKNINGGKTETIRDLTNYIIPTKKDKEDIVGQIDNICYNV